MKDCQRVAAPPTRAEHELTRETERSIAKHATAVDYAGLVAGQRAYFKAGKTRPAAWRIEQLNAIGTMIDESRDDGYEALWHDLRRNKTDADLMDVGFNIREADYALKHIGDWMKQEKIHTPLLMEPGHVRLAEQRLDHELLR